MRFPGRLLLILAAAPLLLALDQPEPAYSVAFPDGWSIKAIEGGRMAKSPDGGIACVSGAQAAPELKRYDRAKLNPMPAKAWNDSVWRRALGVRPALMIVIDTQVTVVGDYQVQSASMFLAPTAIDSTSPEAFSTHARIVLPGWTVNASCFTKPGNRQVAEGVMRQTVESLRLN